MKRIQSFVFELRPSGAQRRRMRRLAGCARYVYNRALALQKARYAEGESKLGYAGICQELVAWKRDPETAWLAEAHSQVLQQSLKDLERAYKNFFEGRAEFPSFKKRGHHCAFRYPQGVGLEPGNRRVYLPKVGWMRYRKSREVEGTIKNVTVSQQAGGWQVSIQTEREVPAPEHPATAMVGVDLGVANFATLSDGSVVEPLNRFRALEKRLARAQRRLARMVKFSRNWKKQQARISRIHRKIAHARNDFLHKVSRRISQNHAMVVIEDLNVKGMSKSASGTVESPGTNVRAKSGLNKAILDQGWGALRRMLGYKLEWLGGELLAVDPAYTSQRCSRCGHQAAESRPSQAHFECVGCGHTLHADHNAACNILAAGHAVIACGAEAMASAVKQEPAEATRGTKPSGAVGIPAL